MTPLFYAIEVDTYRPGAAAGAAPAMAPWGAMPWEALSQLPAAIESSGVIRASDLGYRTAPSDPGGVVVYPPYLDSAFLIDRKLALSPTETAAGAAWGSITLANVGGRFDAQAATENCDGRGVRVFVGRKVADSGRGIELDPPVAALTTLFQGIATPWFCSDTALTIPLRDATYWLERPAQSALYGGTGGLDGGADLKGLPKPKTRGFVRNVTPVLIDATNRIYQWTDGLGAIGALYEGGATGIGFQADVSDLYTGTTSAGSFRTNAARGLFQLGSSPTKPITVDASGATATTLCAIAKAFLLSDMALPSALLDGTSFDAADSLYPYAAGFFLGSSPAEGAAIASSILTSIGAKLVPTRSGKLRLVTLRAIPAGTMPAATFDRTNAVSLVPQPLGAPLDPPPYRWQVGYARSWTVQTSDLSPSIGAAQKLFVAASDRFATWIGTDVLTAYRRPSDPPQVPTYLTNGADADLVAAAYGALWGVRRRLYALTVPVAAGMLRELGDVVRLVWPMDDLRPGRLGQVVGEQFRAGASTTTLAVLV